jgi:hypothetical protein
VTVFSVPNDTFFSNYWLSYFDRSSKDGRITREIVRLKLEKSNIESRPLWKPMHLQPVFSEYPYYGNTVAETLLLMGFVYHLAQILRKRIDIE